MRLDAAALLGIDVVDHRAAILAVVAGHLAVVHAATCGRVEIKPLRLSSKLCLYSPCFDLVRHALDVIQSVVGQPGAAHADQLARLEHAAVAQHVEFALAGDRVGPLRRFGQTDHDRLRQRTLGQVVAHRRQFGRNRRDQTQRRIERRDRRNRYRNDRLGQFFVIKNRRDRVQIVVERKRQRLDVGMTRPY